MSDSSDSLEPSYFDRVYDRDPDPWGFRTRPYERAKYDATLKALGHPRYRRALEVGCSIGEFTAMLAARVDELIAVDVAESAARASAAARCDALEHVRIARAQIPRSMPEGDFDLITLCEVGYYWSRDELDRALSSLTGALRPGGELLMVHWRPFVEEYPLRGDEVHERALDLAARAAINVEHEYGSINESYRVDRFSRAVDRGPRGG